MHFQKSLNPDIIALLGTWDPLLPRHRALFKQLIASGKKQGLNPCIIIIYPNPANFVHNNMYKDYFDLPARIELFKRLGINNVMVLNLGPDDLHAGAPAVFDELLKDKTITLRELWTGENQYFGNRDNGLPSAIAAECAQRNIKLRILKNSFKVVIDKDDVTRKIHACKFNLAAEVVGYLPTYKLNNGGHLKMYDGTYSAMLRISPFDKTNELPVNVTIANEQLEGFTPIGGYDWLVLVGRTGGENVVAY